MNEHSSSPTPRVARFGAVLVVTWSGLAACQVIIGVEERSAAERPEPSPGLADGAPDLDATDAGAVCDLGKPFGTPSPLSALNTVDGEFGATLSVDELEIFYTTTTPGSAVVHRATRARRDLPFSAGSIVEELRAIPAPHWSVSLAPDGVTLFVTARGTPRDVYRATRSSPTSPFGSTARIVFPSWSGATPEEQVFATSGGQLYIGVQWGPQVDLFVAAPAEGGGNQTPTPLIYFNTPKASEAWPVESLDGLTFFYAAGDGVKSEILESHRTAPGMPFLPGVALSFPGSPRKHPLWSSPDGCRLYFVQDNAPGGGGGSDLWVAARPP